MSSPHGGAPSLLGVVGPWHVLTKKGYRATGGRCEREVKASESQTNGGARRRAYSCVFCAATITTEPWSAAEGPGRFTHTQKRLSIQEHLASCAAREVKLDVGMRLALWVRLPVEARPGMLTFSRPTLRAVWEGMVERAPLTARELSQLDWLADLFRAMEKFVHKNRGVDPVQVRREYLNNERRVHSCRFPALLEGLDEFTAVALLATASTEATHAQVHGPGDCSGGSTGAVRDVPLRQPLTDTAVP